MTVKSSAMALFNELCAPNPAFVLATVVLPVGFWHSLHVHPAGAATPLMDVAPVLSTPFTYCCACDDVPQRINRRSTGVSLRKLPILFRVNFDCIMIDFEVNKKYLSSS